MLQAAERILPGEEKPVPAPAGSMAEHTVPAERAVSFFLKNVVRQVTVSAAFSLYLLYKDERRNAL